jgi:exosortase
LRRNQAPGTPSPSLRRKWKEPYHKAAADGKRKIPLANPPGLCHTSRPRFMDTTPRTEKLWDTTRLALVAAWVVCLGWAHFPTMKKTAEGFMNPENEMFYGWLVVPVALLMVASLWKRLRFAAGRPAWGGLVLLVVSLALSAPGQHTGRLFPRQLAMLLSIPAVVWTGWGRTAARILFLPTAFLLFIIPLNLPGLDSESLASFSGTAASALMNGAGFKTGLFHELDEVTGVFLTNPARTFQFHVADVCSGRRSVSVVIVMSAAYGFFHCKTLPRILVLMACSIPFVLAANVLRIVVMCAFSHLHGGGKVDLLGYSSLTTRLH